MAVARSGQPVVNAHVKTIAKLALDLAGPLVAEQELEFVGPGRAHFLLIKSCSGCGSRAKAICSAWPPACASPRTVYGAIDALRRAGLGPDDLPARRFEVDVKGREIREILTEYVRELDERKWVDRAGVVRLAIQRVTLNHGRSAGRRFGTCAPRRRYSGAREPAARCLARATTYLVSGRPAGAWANERWRLVDRRSPAGELLPVAR